MSTAIDTTITSPTEKELLEEQVVSLQKRILELQGQQHIENQRAARETRFAALEANVEREAKQLEIHTTVNLPAAHAALDAAITEVFRSSAAGYSQVATSTKVNGAASAVLTAKISELRCEANLASLRKRLEDETRMREAAQPQ